jgi:hypothetical protein
MQAMLSGINGFSKFPEGDWACGRALAAAMKYNFDDEKPAVIRLH